MRIDTRHGKGRHKEDDHNEPMVQRHGQVNEQDIGPARDVTGQTQDAVDVAHNAGHEQEDEERAEAEKAGSIERIERAAKGVEE